jgi:hypothetical protein
MESKEMRRIVAAVFMMSLFLLTGCSSLIHSSTQPVSTSQPGINSASSNSVSGLNLSLSLDSATYQPGQTITIVVNETNNLKKTNSVSAADNWAFSGLTVGPCGTLNYPFGIAIFKGYHTPGDVSSLTPLKLDNPDAKYPCPMILAEISTYVFQPSGNTTAIFQMDNNNPALTENMNAKVLPTGYWTGTPIAALTNFIPGIYTVVAGDEWGAMVFLYFTVS